jgi:glycosyltransferase involved in cell wall biosynthesis
MTSIDQPLTSVVIPCYNAGRFLADAIESVLRQTHPAVEIIVVNDGSTDDTAAVAAKYRGIRYVEQRNQGVASARNAGLRECRGDYVIFLDADDKLLPHAVETGIDWLRRHPDWAFVAGHVQVVREDGSVHVPAQSHRGGDSYLALLRSNYIWTPGAVMYRRSVFDTVAGYEAFAGGSADYDLNIRIARRFPIGCHHQVILEYRQHGNNMSSDCGYMLQSAVRVRRSQWKYVPRDEVAEQAWKAGMGFVQDHYGGRLVEQIKADLRVRGRRRRAFRGMLRLLQYYPAGAIQVVSAGITRVLIPRR